VWASLSPPDRKAQRKPIAEKLYKQGFTMEVIATQLGVSVYTISTDLKEFLGGLKIKPAKTASNPKGAGRPKGSKKPKATASSLIPSSPGQYRSLEAYLEAYRDDPAVDKAFWAFVKVLKKAYGADVSHRKNSYGLDILIVDLMYTMSVASGAVMSECDRRATNYGLQIPFTWKALKPDTMERVDRGFVALKADVMRRRGR
jgi:hypothetical protein